jgi:hypothetical protein
VGIQEANAVTGVVGAYRDPSRTSADARRAPMSSKGSADYRSQARSGKRRHLASSRLVAISKRLNVAVRPRIPLDVIAIDEHVLGVDCEDIPRRS